MERADELHEWTHSNGVKSLSELHDEARRRWPELTSFRISQIIVLALKKETEG